MYELVSFLSTILPIIATILLLGVTTVNLYLKLRRKFRISVNCWFCNSWTKVEYDCRNCFECPNCLQYNGFNKDGDYNKFIPEQHDELMNDSKISGKACHLSGSNGLCALCNNNQRLKIFQLAHYVPMKEENYDNEIEHFREQLEKAYKLCKKCDKVLKNTLDKQTKWIFGTRIKNMCSKSVSKITEKINTKHRMKLLAKLEIFLTLFLILITVFTILSKNNSLTNFLSKYIPKEYSVIYKNVIWFMNTKKMVHFNFEPYFSKILKLEPFVVVTGSSFVYNLVKLSIVDINTKKLNQFLCWVILLLTSFTPPSLTGTGYVYFIQAFCCIYLFITTFDSKVLRASPSTNGRKMRKIIRNLEKTTSDISSDSDFEETVNSTPPSPKFSPISNLNHSLNNLHLNFPLKRPKPVLSPPRLQSPPPLWNGFVPLNKTSRSSSESSGFGGSINGRTEFDRMSDFYRMSPTPPMVHPNWIFFQRNHSNWSDRIFANGGHTSFRDLRLLQE